MKKINVLRKSSPIKKRIATKVVTKLRMPRTKKARIKY